MNAKNTIKNLAIMLLSVTIFSTCDTSDIEQNDEDKFKIEAKVENALKYSDVAEVKLMVYDRSVNKYVELARGDWKDGGFAIELPKMLAPKYLHTLINRDRLQPTILDMQSTMSISNKNVKVWNARFWGVDKDGNMVTPLFPFVTDKGGNAKHVFYTYVDSDVTILGHTVREGVAIDTEFHNELFKNMMPNPIWFNKITTTYSVEWKEGWNVWSFSRFYPVSMDGTLTEKWSATPPGSVKWYGVEDLRNINF